MNTLNNNKIDFAELEEFIEKRHIYFSDRFNMISEYRREKQINDDYKGRQLLELIQNADDAGSRFVKIEIDTKKKILRIYNEGEPFSVGGYRSLMITNLSTKRKKKYIGNKGLGFRSILNWSEKVLIESSNCSVIFSNEQAKLKYYELYPSEEVRKSILVEFDYNEGIIPFPVFALPSIIKSDSDSELTKIEIDYNDSVEKDILNQIQTLRKEVLLFLNHIEKIQISIDDTKTEYLSSREFDTIKIDQTLWKLYSNRVDNIDPVLPARYKNPESNEEESYSIKIAIQEGLKDNINKLFTYFPTKISLQFPMVIHGTFELDSSRNRITETEKNRFLVGELIKLIFEIGNSFFGEQATWDKFRLLNYKGNRDPVLEEFGFYKSIDSKLKTLPVYPCLDGKYRSYNEIKFYSNNFAEIIDEIKQQLIFPDVLQKIPDEILQFFKDQFPNYQIERKYSEKTLKEKVEAVSKEICNKVSVSQYAKWLTQLSYHFVTKNILLSVLYNEKQNIIESTNTIFTPPSKNALIEVPEHIKMDYLNADLFNGLVNSFKITDDNEKARKLKDKLESFINIQSFEPAPVLTKIVTNTNQLINGTSNLEEKKRYTIEMIKSLFNYYNLSSRAKDSQIRTSNIPVINQAGDIIYSKDSFLSDQYRFGKIRQELLGNLYAPNLLIGSATDLGLENNEEIEEFLVDFLGVNKFLQLEWVDEKINPNPNPNYINYVFNLKEKPDRYRSAKIAYTQIKNIDVIKSIINAGTLTREDFICWICLDSDIKEKLHSYSDSEFRYDLTNQVTNTYSYKLADVPSYIRFQLNEINMFNGYLLNDLGIPIINDFQIEFRNPKFIHWAIDSSVIKETLIQLGAKTEFVDLSIERIETILKSLPTKDEHGKHARKIYQLTIDRFKEKNELLKNYNGLELHSSQDKSKKYIVYSDVFYANNIGLPRKILNEKALFNYPKRSGEQNISDFFKVKTFDHIEYSAKTHSVNEYSSSELGKYLRQIRPFILVHRLQRLKSENDIREAIRIIKSLNIILCEQLVYDFNGTTNEAEIYDFVPSKEDKFTYLIKYDSENKIELLKQDSNLSDVISEIYSIAFDLANLRSEIRAIFRNDLYDTNHQIIEEFGEENLLNAKSKLEITHGELSFWKAIYEIKDLLHVMPTFDDENDFRKVISEQFQIERSLLSQIDFDFLDWKSNQKYLKELFIKLKIALSNFNSNTGLGLNFQELHDEQIRSEVEKIKQDFIMHFWKQLSDGEIEKQKTFISTINSVTATVANKIAEEIRSILEVSYADLVFLKIEQLYGVRITNNVIENIYINLYNQNLIKIGLVESNINTLSNEDRSTLYFELSEELVNKFKERFSINNSAIIDAQKNIDPLSLSYEPSKPITPLPPSRKKLKAGKYRQGNTTSNGHRSGSHSFEDDLARKQLGEKSENEVLKSLKEQYSEENVVWLSGYSNHPEKGDHWGYDIKYRETRESDWNFVEVKSFYRGTFFFTQTEMQVATENLDRYYIYLVTDNEIKSILISNILNDNNELNYQNDYFSIEIKDYKFTRL
jgi:hypothetical protein